MGRSSLLNKYSRIVFAGTLTLQALPVRLIAEVPRPFPVLGTVAVSGGHWNDTPELIEKLSARVMEESIRFQLTASQAEQQFSIGLLDESRDAFLKLLRAKKPSPSQHMQNVSSLRIAEIALLQGKVDDAMKQASSFITKDGNPYISHEALFLQARCLLVKQDWPALQKSIQQLVRTNPAYSNDLAVNLLRGVAALEQKRPDEALVYLKRYPEEPSAMYYQAVAFIQKKEISNALPLYQQILQKSPNSEWVDRMRMALGEAFYNGHDIPLAQEFFKPVTRPAADPVLRPLALHRRGCLFFESKNFTEADEIFTSLLKEYPKHQLRTQWTYLYASIPIFKKDWKKAIQEQRMALEFSRGLAPRIHGADEKQLRLSAEFRILWAHLLLNNFNGSKILADKFITRYPKEPITAYAYLAKGMSLYRMGDYDRALEVYQDLLNKFPNSSATGKAVYLMTLGLHSARDPFRMAGILNEVHNRMSKAIDSNVRVDEWTQNTLYWIGDAYYQLNDLVSAEKIYKEFILKAPQSPLVPYALENLAATLSAQGPSRDGEAIIALNQAQMRSRDLGNKALAEQVEVELAKVYYNQREFAKAAAAWNHLVQVSTQPSVRAESMYREADAMARQDFYQEAIKRWKTLVQSYRSDPIVPDALMRIGNTQAGLGQWAEAANTFGTLKKSYAGSEAGKEGAFQLIQCAFNQGDFKTAVNELLAFAKQYPDDARISKAADNLLSSFHQKKIAVPAAQQAQLLKLAPGSAGGAALLWERGASLFNEGKYEPAQKLFEKIMLSYPNDEYAPLAYFYNADCFFWLQKWDDAANAYQNFFLSFPKHERVPNAMFQKAVCLFRKGTFDEAVVDFKAFLTKFPSHPLAKEAWLNIALAHKKAFQLDQAVSAYKYVIENYAADPKINAVWLQMGALLEVQGKHAEAQRTYAKVAKGSAEYPESLYRAATLLDQRKNIAESRALLEQLRELPDKKSEFRLAALIKLSEIYESEGAPAAKLRNLYQDLAASSPDPEVAKQARLRLQELK
jgi:TolA-binding protein